MTRIFFTHSGKQRKADNFGNYINKAAIFAFTENGIRLALKISCELNSYYNGDYKSDYKSGYKSNCNNNYEKHYESNESGCKSFYAGGFEFFNYNNINYRENIEYAFNEYDFLILFLSLGAVIRLISPFIKRKLSDPGVIVIDEKANFAISALSGHIGGANELTAGIAEIIGATPVITTATDVSNKFSLDLFAKKFNLNIENKNCIKYINKSSLNNEKIIIFIPESDNILSKNKEFKNEIKKYFAGFDLDIQLVYTENGIKEILKNYYKEDKESKDKENIENKFKNINNDSQYNSRHNKQYSNQCNRQDNNQFKMINNLNIIVISYKTNVLDLTGFSFNNLRVEKKYKNEVIKGVNIKDKNNSDLDININPDNTADKENIPNINICRLFPRNLSIGIGCNKNTSFEEIENFIEEIFNENNLSMLAIKNIGTIDIKSEEKGILEFAKKYAKYIDFFSKDEINNFINDLSNKSLIDKFTMHADADKHINCDIIRNINLNSSFDTAKNISLNYSISSALNKNSNSDKNLNKKSDYALNINMITESACFRYTGAYSVCEPCALLSSNTNKELLICKKKKGNTTIAAAI